MERSSGRLNRQELYMSEVRRQESGVRSSIRRPVANVEHRVLYSYSKMVQ